MSGRVSDGAVAAFPAKRSPGFIGEAQANLATLLYGQPTLALAGAVAWLDPVSVDDVAYDENYLIFALNVCKKLFPDVYTKAVTAAWSGKTDGALDALICDGIDEHLVYKGLFDLEQVYFGIPYHAQGCDLWGYGETDFEEGYPDLMPILEQMGYLGEQERDSINVVERVAAILRDDLRAYRDNEEAESVGTFLAWLFNATECDMANYTNEMLAENGHQFDWTRENIAFVNDLQLEAVEIIETAMRGSDLLLNNKAWGKAFKKNARKAFEYSLKSIEQRLRAVAKGTPEKRATSIKQPRFTWPRCAAGSYRRAADHAA